MYKWNVGANDNIHYNIIFIIITSIIIVFLTAVLSLDGQKYVCNNNTKKNTDNDKKIIYYIAYFFYFFFVSKHNITNNPLTDILYSFVWITGKRKQSDDWSTIPWRVPYKICYDVHIERIEIQTFYDYICSWSVSKRWAALKTSKTEIQFV